MRYGWVDVSRSTHLTSENNYQINLDADEYGMRTLANA